MIQLVLNVILVIIFILYIERRVVRKIIFHRKTENDLLKEQNALLTRLLEKQAESAPVVVAAEAPPVFSPVEKEAVVFKDEDVVHFIPKAAKATKSDVTNLNTTATSWDSHEVDKLRKAKESLKK